MTKRCGPDGPEFPAPPLTSQPPPERLAKSLARHGIDWRRERHGRPPRPESQAIDTRDAWLVDAWDDVVRQLLARIPGYFVIRTGATRLAVPPAVVPDQLLALSDTRVSLRRGSAPRSALAGYWRRYYWPCTDAAVLRAWLEELVMTAARPTHSRRGAFAAPRGVERLESTHDDATLERLESSMRPEVFRRFGAPLDEPRAPELPVAAPGQERSEQFLRRLARFDREMRFHRQHFERFDAARRAWQRERTKLESLLRDPDAGLARPRKTLPPSVQRLSALGVPLGADVLPSHLFLSQAAPFIEPYLMPIRQLKRVAGAEDIGEPVVAWFYFLVGMALVPIWRHWRLHWGTAVVEDLVPAQLEALEAVDEWINREMVQTIAGAAEDARRKDGRTALSPSAHARQRQVLEGVRDVSAACVAQIRANRVELLELAVDQGGGRIRLDPPTFTGGKPWRIRSVSGTGAPRTLQFPEHVGYAAGLDEDAGWMLRAIWPQVRSVAALCNQAAVDVRINAANNRWGGKHPPHASHTQGTDIDWDVGIQGDWVPNLVQRRGDERRPFSRFFRNEPLEGGDAGPPCQIGIDRLALWIGVQANLIAGVRVLLYGDEPLIDDAARHFNSLFAIRRPARSVPTPEPRHHHNHLHVEYLPDAVVGCAGPLAWAVRDTDDLVTRLETLAEARDADLGFWNKLAGLDAIPSAAADFEALRGAYASLDRAEIERQIRGWGYWWQQRSLRGRPLLPVWNPALANDTRDALVCAIGRTLPQGLPT